MLRSAQLIALSLLAGLAGLAAVELEVIEGEGGRVIIRPVADPGPREETTAIGRPQAGRADPVRAAASAAYEIDWREYRTLVVVEEREGKRSRAWVATLRRSDQHLQVCYTGTAFRDVEGNLHIDCQGARVGGPNSRGWSPDSFSIDADGGLRIIDDRDSGSAGRLASSTVPGEDAKNPADSADALDYREAQLRVRAYIYGDL